MPALAIYVRLHDGRYHGNGDWPPSPARLFQALVAGAGISGPLNGTTREAFMWLEAQTAPTIAAPRAWQARRGVLFYMPNNDSDRIEGDPSRIAEIRTATKTFRPYLFDPSIPFVYAWSFPPALDDRRKAETVCSLAARLYQLGRGIDMAWAWGEIIEDGELDALLAAHPGEVFRPSKAAGGRALPAPYPSSFTSVERRYLAYAQRFSYRKEGRSVQVVFRQPPRPLFRLTGYESPSSRQVYELRDPEAGSAFAPWPLERAYSLVVKLRDAAVDKLKRAVPASSADIDRVLMGRAPDGANDCPPESRVRIVPLPSIGHVHADREIRRILVETPPACPVRPDDIQWAFSGLALSAPDNGEAVATLIRTDDDSFLRHYGLQDDPSCRVWRTVTPAVLPQDARRRRIDPARKLQESKAGTERTIEQARAASSVGQALRHAGLQVAPEAIRVQREPFETNGRRVEEFAEETRFDKHRLWHIEVEFRAPVRGLLAIGDGRFVGLGVMAPLLQTTGVYALAVESGLVGSPHPESLARALRRALMARVQEHLNGPMPTFFSGHEADGAPARGPGSAHIAIAFDEPRNRFLIIAPHILERRPPSHGETQDLTTLDHAIRGLTELRTGATGVLSLGLLTLNTEADPLFAPSRVWTSLTQYRVTRHARAADAREALARDLEDQLRLRGFPQAKVAPLACRGIAGCGLEGTATLEFKIAVPGPVLLGRSRYLGGGLFTGEPRPDTSASTSLSTPNKNHPRTPSIF